MTENQTEELYALLGKQVYKFTSGESTSVSIETAERILRSIDYCINSYYKSLDNPIPYDRREEYVPISTAVVVTSWTELSLEDIFESGLKAVKGCVENTKELLIKVQDSLVDVDNIAYQDTIQKGLAHFFPTYQPRFGAQLCDADIDYPLAVEVEGLEGVEFMYEYLRRLYLENQFLGRFDPAKINLLLRGYHHEAREYLINIFEVVLQNVLGLSLLSTDTLEPCQFNDLNISLSQQEVIYHILKSKNLLQISLLLEEHARLVLEKLDLVKEDMITYVMTKVKDISYRLLQNLKLKNLTYIFVMFEDEDLHEEAYFEGAMMPDEELRMLIDEMSAMRYLKDKLVLLKGNVHSLNDLKEVLKECFAGDEYAKVFQLLLPQEKNILLEQAKANLAFYNDETMLLEWERALLDGEG